MIVINLISFIFARRFIFVYSLYGLSLFASNNCNNKIHFFMWPFCWTNRKKHIINYVLTKLKQLTVLGDNQISQQQNSWFGQNALTERIQFDAKLNDTLNRTIYLNKKKQASTAPFHRSQHGIRVNQIQT